MPEWKNLSGSDFAKDGGIMIKQDENKNTDYQFFKLQVDNDGNKYAYFGTAHDIKDYYCEVVLEKAALESEYDTVEEYIEAEPESTIEKLLDVYDAAEFGATNWQHVGAYSLDKNIFKVNDSQLVDFMEQAELPEEFIPTFEFDFENARVNDKKDLPFVDLYFDYTTWVAEYEIFKRTKFDKVLEKIGCTKKVDSVKVYGDMFCETGFDILVNLSSENGKNEIEAMLLYDDAETADFQSELFKVPLSSKEQKSLDAFVNRLYKESEREMK